MSKDIIPKSIADSIIDDGQMTAEDVAMKQEAQEALNAAPIGNTDTYAALVQKNDVNAAAKDTGTRIVTLDQMKAEAKRSMKEVKKMGRMVPLIHNVIFKNSTTVFYGGSGSGKTKITVILSLDLLEENEDYTVLYMALDPSQDQLIDMIDEAEERGVEDRFLVRHDVNADNILETMEALAAGTKTKLNNIVLVIDTLKKIASVNNKDGAAKVMEQIKLLRTKGLTTILLAHTNKDDVSISGVADFTQDSDNVCRVEGERIGDDRMKVSVMPSEDHRCRAAVEPFSIDTFRDGYKFTVTSDHVDKNGAKAIAMEYSQMGNLGKIAVEIVDEYAAKNEKLNQSTLMDELKAADTYDGTHKTALMVKFINRISEDGIIKQVQSGRSKRV